MSRRSLGRAGALVLTAFASTVLALGNRPRPVRPKPATLKTAYRIHLQSTWPQLASDPEGCLNGGGETLDGMLTANGDGTYGGTFTRNTRLLFCGAHGSDDARSCALTLRGGGQVSVTAAVVADESSPSGRVARLVWVPGPDHQADITGTCPASFKEAVEAMYLGVRHSVELPL